jgi:hypothetical protein
MTATPQPEPQPINLDGRVFFIKAAGKTAGQSAYLIGLLREIGVTQFPADIDHAEKTSRALTRIFRYGFVFRLLAAYLVEKDKPWTHFEAERNAARFEQLTDLAQKAEMWAIVTAVAGHLCLSDADRLMLAPTPALPS